MNTRLYRSRTDRIISGVCGGIAEMLNVDPSIVRILFAILVPLTGGLIILLYLVMSFVVPEQPAGDERWAIWEQQAAGPVTQDAPGAPGAPVSPLASMPPVAPLGPDAPTTAFAPPPSSPAAGPVPTPSPPAPDSWRPEPRGAVSGGGSGALIIGLILVLLGGFFLARSYLPNIDWDRSWPILLVGIGVVLLLGAIRRASPGPR